MSLECLAEGAFEYRGRGCFVAASDDVVAVVADDTSIALVC